MGACGMTGQEIAEEQDFVTVVTAGQVFGLNLDRVRDVFMPRGLSPVPLAPPEVVGLLNLRGRIVTAVDLRRRLGLGPHHGSTAPVAVGIEDRGEHYGLIVDAFGEVLRLPRSRCETNPVNLDERWATICDGVYQLEDGLMVVIDVDKVLAFDRVASRADG
jgi:purine-binding chemotaxis protein CheW